ncbi:MAG: aldehyde dehydrogenase family protein, partial [Pseudomonadota bacterium]|nr:aldehyde dehydrogenase family protein [Pseudomonadota bacterium]
MSSVLGNKENNRKVNNWIDGKLSKSSSDRYEIITDSATGEQCASVIMSSEDDVNAAIRSSSIAFETWSRTSVLKRAKVMFKLKELIERDRKEIAKIITQEHGKVLDDAEGSIQRGLEVVEFACGMPHLIKGEYNDQVGTGVDTYSMRQPLGVCVGITPFNFPAMVPLWMFPLAITCGNT